MTPVTNLGDLVDRAGDPDKPLRIGAGPGGADAVLSRAGLDAAADAFARGFLRGGLARGDRIAVLSENRPDAVAVMLGAMRAGLVPVPVNHRFPPATVADVIADCGARLAVCDAARRAALPAGLPPGLRVAVFDAPGLDPSAPDGLDRWRDPGPFAPVVPHPDEAGLFLYTSGSTGRPKGVRLSHASHIWVARTRMAEFEMRDERVLIAAPLYHMNALALAVLVCAAGATAVLLPQFEARAYIEAIARHRCTWLTAVPPMIAMMLREREALAGADLSSVRTVRMGSAPVGDALAAQARALLPNARIINAFGTTEGGPVVFTRHPDGLPTPTASVGYPHPQVSVRLVGAGAPETGVLQMRSPALMLGYHNRPDARSPITADGYYDTGDVFRRDAHGFHYVLGRTDDMFVSGGENIFPGEVELVLERHADVVQACVVPVEDAIKGTKPVAFVVRRPGAALDEEAVRRFALAHAPAYQHPRRVWFVDALPLASTNKIDRAGLRLRAEEAMRA